MVRIKGLSRSRSRKSLKRKGSMDEETIERLSKPVDHAATRRKFERSQKKELQQSRLASSRSRSCSVRKGKTSHADRKQLQKSYRSFIISKFGKEQERAELVATEKADRRDADHWGTAKDFTRIDSPSKRAQQSLERTSLRKTDREKRELARASSHRSIPHSRSSVQKPSRERSNHKFDSVLAGRKDAALSNL